MTRSRWGVASGAVALVAVGVALLLATSADAVPQGFQREYFYGAGSGVNNLVFPTNLEFAPDGRMFITEKRGVIKTATTPGGPLTLVADMREVTHSHWDRGMLGLAVHPDYPDTPYLYVLYAHGTPLDIPGGPIANWESGPGVDEDTCTDPGGGTTDGCVVSAQLTRLQLNTSTMTVVAQDVLIRDWCQQFPSHSVGDLVFGDDGALYVSAGDGASFGPPDYGQFGGTLPNPSNPLTPRNPCGDPPAGAGGVMTEETGHGGAFRSQSLVRDEGPVVANGSILRINPLADPGDPTSLVLADNPNADHVDPMGRLVVAHGLRNPYRFTVRPGTNDLYIADVGYNTWEEVNRHPNPTDSVRNFGWPCYEGGNGQSLPQPGYSALGACEEIEEGDVTSPFFSYRHNEDIEHPANDDCPPAVTGQTSRTSSSTTGIAFYSGGSYPHIYTGALFGSDYSRECIWVMYPGPGGIPDPDTVQVFHYEPTIWKNEQGALVPDITGVTPVDLEMGPDGRLYGVSYMRGQIFRFNWLGSNHAPVVQIDIAEGSEENQYVLDGTGSFDPDGDAVTFGWDLSGDGQYDGGSDPVVTREFEPGMHIVGLRVTDSLGASDTAFAAVINGPQPEAEITSPNAGISWAVGDTIAVAGEARDAQGDPIPADRLRWQVMLNHCAQDGSCHQHLVTQFPGATGSFDAPDHEESSLQITLQALHTDGRTIIASDRVVISPETVQLTFDSNIAGVDMTVLSIGHVTPFSVTSIVGSTVHVTTPETVTRLGATYYFARWSHGGGRNQTLQTPGIDTTYTAIYELQTADDPFRDDDGSIFEDDIEWLAAKGITRGCNPPVNDRFCPDGYVTRGQMAAFFVRALDLPAGPGDRFDDDDGHLFEAEIDRLANSGITRGCNPPANTRFCPDDFVTRGQMAAFFARAFGLDEGASDNLFVDDNGHLFEAEINMLATADITRGCNPPTNDRFCPESFVTRGQMAAFFHRAAAWLP